MRTLISNIQSTIDLTLDDLGSCAAIAALCILCYGLLVLA
jgi:hypothetical protein